ncbi:MAG TPA: hypothetical protein VGD35_11865 [Chitinophaga sp.]
MNLRTYIDSGAVECYLLGLASAEEEALLHEMRRLHPELESEISVTAFKLQEAAMEGGIKPPAEVWDNIVREVKREERKAQQQRHYRRRSDEPAYTVINLQEAPPRRYIKVSIWWRCAFIALCMLVMALLASNIYFYRKYHEMEERVLRQQPSNQLPPASTK